MGDPMPGDLEILPPPETLLEVGGCTVATDPVGEPTRLSEEITASAAPSANGGAGEPETVAQPLAARAEGMSFEVRQRLAKGWERAPGVSFPEDIPKMAARPFGTRQVAARESAVKETT